MATISFTGLIVPRAFETWETARSFVRFVRRRGSSSSLSSPLSVIGTTRREAPLRSQRSCHGTMFEWCSSPVRRISSPSRTKACPKLVATRLIASVVPRTKTISFVSAAPTKRRTSSRAPS